MTISANRAAKVERSNERSKFPSGPSIRKRRLLDLLPVRLHGEYLLPAD
jgi:hypothetical protein